MLIITNGPYIHPFLEFFSELINYDTTDHLWSLPSEFSSITFCVSRENRPVIKTMTHSLTTFRTYFELSPYYYYDLCDTLIG